MKPIETAGLAVAVCNISLSRGSAKLMPAAVGVARHVIERLRLQCRQQNVHLDVDASELNEPLAEVIQARVLSGLKQAQEQLAGASLPSRFHSKLDRVIESITHDPFDGVRADARLDELTHDLLTELSEPMFLQVAPERRALYEQNEPPFGTSVHDTFPTSARDIAAAARCFALDEWTACVFHLMRALEAPLHDLATKVGISFPSPLDLENWKNIIDKIESEVNRQVKELEQQKKGHERNDRLKFYGQAALQMRHFKNAWRNGAAHGRDHYEEYQATVVFESVKTFMQTLANPE